MRTIVVVVVVYMKKGKCYNQVHRQHIVFVMWYITIKIHKFKRWKKHKLEIINKYKKFQLKRIFRLVLSGRSGGWNSSHHPAH